MFPHQDSEMVGVDLRTSMGCNLKNPVECASLTLDTFFVLSLIFFSNANDSNGMNSL